MSSEYPMCWSITYPKARKRHRCIECSTTIEPGTEYVVFSGVWSFGPDRYKICAECWDLRSVESGRSDTKAFGDLVEYVQEAPLYHREIKPEIAEKLEAFWERWNEAKTSILEDLG